MFNRFDIIEGYYWYCTEYHEGQDSAEYKVLSRISRYFSPSPFAKGPSSEGAQAVYNGLVRKFARYRNR